MESKSILLSVTFWGLIVSVLAQIAARYGVTVDQAGLANDFVSLAGAALTVWGRLRANQPTHLIQPKETP